LDEAVNINITDLADTPDRQYRLKGNLYQLLQNTA